MDELLLKTMLHFRLFFAYAPLMSFHGASTRIALVVRCKGCSRQVTAGIRSIPDNAVVISCPLCKEPRRYRPSEIYEGRIALGLIEGGGKKPAERMLNPWER